MQIERWWAAPATYSVATTATDNGGSGVDGAAAPVVLGGGGDVGVMRRSVARSMVVSVEPGADWSGGDEAVQSPVLCSSGGRRTRSGATASGLLGREMMSRRCGTKWRFG